MAAARAAFCFCFCSCPGGCSSRRAPPERFSPRILSTTTSTRFLSDLLRTATKRRPGKHRASAAIVLASFAPHTPPLGGRQQSADAVVGGEDFFCADEEGSSEGTRGSSVWRSRASSALARAESLSSAALTSAGVNPCRFAERAARVSATCRFFSSLFSPLARRGFFCRRTSSARRVASGAEAPARPVLHAHAGAPSAPGAEAAATISSAVASGGNHGAPSSSDPDDDDVEDARAPRGSRDASDASSSDASSNTASAANEDPNLGSSSTSSSELDALVASSRYAAAPSMRDDRASRGGAEARRRAGYVTRKLCSE